MDQPYSKCQTVWGAVVYTFKVQKNHQEVYIKCGYTGFAHWPNKWHPQHRWWRPPATNRSQLRCETDDDMYQRRSTWHTVVFNPLTPTVAIWVQLYRQHPVPDRVRFDIRALWCSGLSVRVPRCQNVQMTA